jgi:branched-subunit amino acid transport protein AzlD
MRGEATLIAVATPPYIFRAADTAFLSTITKSLPMARVLLLVIRCLCTAATGAWSRDERSESLLPGVVVFD